jgi:glycosyltransferase involved in cell wall biosynthesis
MSLFQQSAKVRLLELRNTYKWGGGPDKTILLSAEQHDRSRVEVVVVYVRDVRDREFSIGDKARAKRLMFYEIEERGKLDFQVLCALREIVIRHDINIIHAHDYKSDLFAYLLRRKLKDRGLAVISTMHGWALSGVRGRIFWHLDLLLMRQFDRIIAVSHATKEEMVVAGMPSDLISVIHNGIDTETWSQGQLNVSMRDALGIGNAFPIIGYVGRISPEKDLGTWLRAAALVAQEYPAAQFVVVGEGRDNKLIEQLKTLAAALDIAHKVYFLGYREDLPSIYATFDLFFLSSRREGICNSLLEAMAMGIPIVATDAGGTKELIINGKTGCVVAAGEAEAMARATVALIRDETLRKKMGKDARNHIEQKFSFSSRLRRIETLYENILNSGRSRQGPNQCAAIWPTDSRRN